MLDSVISEEVLSILAGAGADFAELFAERAVTNSLFLEDSRIEKINTGIDKGVGLRLIRGETTIYSYTNLFDRDTLIELAREMAALGKEGNMPHQVTLRRLETYRPDHCKVMPDAVSLGAKVDILRSMDKAARAVSGFVSQVSARYADTQQQVYIANSEGLAVEDTRVRSRAAINVIAEKDGTIQTGFEGPGQARGWEFIEELDKEGLARRAAGRAVQMLDARPAPAGRMVVVLSGEAGGTMIHEACGHALEADFIHKRTSIFTDMLGSSIASPLITVIDEGAKAYEFGFLHVDDEGTPTRRTVLIENGVLRNYLTDRLNARLLGLPLTGNGRRESYRNKPVPRMTNTYIAPGNSDPQDIIDSVDNGLLVLKMGGGQVNTTNGDFVFEVSEGYLIQGGKVTHPVRGATLTGNGPAVLRSVDMVGNDLHFIPGVCGKGDHAPVSDAQPTLRIPEIVVGGQS